MADPSLFKDEAASPDEVLVGAELYFYLLNENERQLRETQRKSAEYQALRENLLDLVKRPRRQVMAPVAGGLAYFETTLTTTNNVLVLLGDGWFAERSASQAAEIAGRRIDFLKRELQVLQEERRSYEARQELFLSEMPDADAAMMNILEAKEQAMEKAHNATLATTTTSGRDATLPSTAAGIAAKAEDRPVASAAVTSQGPVHTAAAAGLSSASSSPSPSAPAAAPPPPPTAADDDAKPTRAASSAAPALSSSPPLPPPPTPGPPLPADIMSLAAQCGLSAEDLKAMSVIDESDDLTEEELMDLEKELGDRIDDDEYVEQVMMERVVAKTERRLRDELQRRVATQPAHKAASSTAPPVTSPKVFHSPADIGQLHAVPASAPTAEADVPRTEATQPPASSSPSPSSCPSSAAPATAKKQVTFAETVDVRMPPSEGPTGLSATAPLAASPASASASSAGNRRSIAVGDVVEHQGSDSAVHPTPSLPSKRKSLFMRGLDGDN